MSAATTTTDQGRSQLEAEIVRVTAEVAEAVARATAAVLDGDRELMEVVTARHYVIALDCRALEDAATAGDDGSPELAARVAAARISGELAAAGAAARDIAAAVPRVPPTSLTPRVRGLLSRVGDETRRLVIAALDGGEPRVAAVEDLHRRLLAEVFAGAMPLSTAVELTIIGRDYARLAGHALAVADQVRTLSRSGR